MTNRVAAASQQSFSDFASRELSTLTVIGCGAVGLPLAVAFASRDFTVRGVDTDARRVALLSEGVTDRPEEGLSDALKAVVTSGRIAFSASPAPCPDPCAFILAVPALPDDSSDAELERAFRSALDVTKDGDLLIIRSTVPIGTTRRFSRVAIDGGRHLAHCPDRSISGRGFSDQFQVPNVVGGIDAASIRLAATMFSKLGPVIEVGSPEAAEAIKLFANVQRDVTFAMANEFALICEHLGLDYFEISRAGSEGYGRFAPTRPGPVGGPCLPKDPFLLAQSVADEELVRLPLAARAVNASLVDHVANAISAHLASRPRGSVVVVLGLEFKGEPRTNDTRGSFGLALADRLRTEHPQSELRTFEPSLNGGSGLLDAIRGADAIILANDNPALRGLDLDAAAGSMRAGGLIYDMYGSSREAAEILPNQVTVHVFGVGRRP